MDECEEKLCYFLGVAFAIFVLLFPLIPAILVTIVIFGKTWIIGEGSNFWNNNNDVYHYGFQSDIFDETTIVRNAISCYVLTLITTVLIYSSICIGERIKCSRTVLVTIFNFTSSMLWMVFSTQIDSKYHTGRLRKENPIRICQSDIHCESNIIQWEFPIFLLYLINIAIGPAVLHFLIGGNNVIKNFWKVKFGNNKKKKTKEGDTNESGISCYALKVNDAVYVKHEKYNSRLEGVIKYISSSRGGECQPEIFVEENVNQKFFIGLLLTGESAGMGDTDGLDVNSEKRYFKCPPNSAIFITVNGDDDAIKKRKLTRLEKMKLERELNSYKYEQD